LVSCGGMQKYVLLMTGQLSDLNLCPELLGNFLKAIILSRSCATRLHTTSITASDIRRKFKLREFNKLRAQRLGHKCFVYKICRRPWKRLKFPTCYHPAVYRKESFPSKESDTKILQSIHFGYKVGITSSVKCMKYKTELKEAQIVKRSVKRI